MNKLSCSLVALICASFAPHAQSAPAIQRMARGFEMNVFAEQPEIVTPIGIAIDKQDRIFVVESHTHQAPPDYRGPSGDLIKTLKDTDGDGVADAVSVFASGFRASMNIGFAREQLYLVQRDRVVILPDANNDGKAEAPQTILHLETEEQYPHNGLDGLAFSQDGWLYVGMGENLGRPYILKGSDGVTHKGQGEGGNIFRCRLDGSKLELFATGFWNPFAITFDQSGRLYCVDNDPDGRPPCRLLHIIEGGDYGYKFRYGRSGLHPFIAWEGEVPGTLGMIAGTGEAPSGILVCREAGWPAQYQNSLLVTSWGDNTLELFDLQPKGATFISEKQVIVQGDTSFRPVGFAVNSKGETFVTDWGDKSYPVHGKGRIWRLRVTTPPLTEIKTRNPSTQTVALTIHPTPAEDRATMLRKADSAEGYVALLDGLVSEDSFVRSSAAFALRKPVFRQQLNKDIAHTNAAVRLGIATVLRNINDKEAHDSIETYLADPAEDVRRLALIWAAESGRKDLLPKVEKTLNQGKTSTALFASYIAAVEILNPSAQKESRSIWAGGDTATGLIEKTLRNPANSARLKTIALSMLPATNSIPAEQLQSFIKSNDAELQAETIFFLAADPTGPKRELLHEIARNREINPELRATAVGALAPQASEQELMTYFQGNAPVVQIEVLRGMRLKKSAKEIASMKDKFGNNLADSTAKQLAHLAAIDEKPRTDQEWLKVLESPGNALAGRRRFFDPSIGCSTCHQVNGRGGMAGPDLSLIARSLDRERIIDSILNPSANIAPEFVTYEFEIAEDSFSGVVRSKGPEHYVAALPDGSAKKIARADLVSQKELKTSLMPDGLENGMTPDDFRNLLSFLLSLK